MDEIRIGDVVMTKKKHPCGSSEWTVIRTGADIKDEVFRLRTNRHAGPGYVP